MTTVAAFLQNVREASPALWSHFTETPDRLKVYGVSFVAVTGDEHALHALEHLARRAGARVKVGIVECKATGFAA